MKHEEELFEQARALTSAEAREGYLLGACGEDRDLRRRVEELLAAHQQAGALDFLAADDRTDKAGPPRSEYRPNEHPGDRIGRYRLLEQIGEGGCGVVYVAEQEEPVRRRVALKVIKLGMDTKSVIARFEAERQALAMMDHPNIAKVFDAGVMGQRSEIRDQRSAGGAADSLTSDLRPLTSGSGRPYFVMELVQGIKITDYCDQNDLSTLERLELFIQVCHAIQHAHQKGIIHRDIKPSNILVALHDGVPVPKVIDFGIAKATGQQRLTDKTLYTAFEQFIGTPAYMSPEQADMSSAGAGDIDTRSDIYSLGVLLYELLTGKTPFEPKTLLAAGLEEMRRIIREQEPARPSTRVSKLAREEQTTMAQRRQTEPPRLIRLLQGDLDWIAMKCLEKDRRRRYETANGLALDIERHLSHEPVVARPPNAVYRVQKFVRRNQLMVTAGAAVALALVLGVVVSSWQAIRATLAEVKAEAALEEALRARDGEAQQRAIAAANEQHALEAQGEAESARASEATLRHQAEAETYAADINLAQHALAANDLGRAKLLLAAYASKEKEHLRGWEWRYLWQQCRSDTSEQLHRYPHWVTTAAFSPSGEFLAVGGYRPPFVDLWDVRSRQRVVSLPGSLGQTLAFSPGGDWLATSATGRGALIRVWQTGTTNLLQELAHPDMSQAQILSLKFSPDGTRLAGISWPGEVALWEVNSWTVIARIPGAGMAGHTETGVLDFSPDSSALVVGGADRRVRVVELDTGSDRFTPLLHPEFISALAWSPRDALIASGTGFSSGLIRLWDANSGELRGTLEGHTGMIGELVFSADGQRLYSASADQTIRIWDVGQTECLAVLRGSTEAIWGLTLSPDGNLLASGCRSGAVDFWDARVDTSDDWPRLRMLDEHQHAPLLRPAIAPDSRVIAAPQQGVVRLFDLETDREIDRIPALGSNVVALVYSPDGARLASGSTDGSVRIGSSAGTRSIVAIPGRGSEIRLLAFSGDGTRLFVLDRGGQATWCDTGSGQTIQSFDAGGSLAQALSPDGRLLVTGHVWGRVRWLDAETGALLKETVGHRDPVNGLAFSPDGAQLASAANDGTITLWEVSTFTPLHSFRSHMGYMAGVAYSPNGRRLLTGAMGHEAVKVWDLATRRELVRLRGEGHGFYYLEFSPDGQWLASCNWSPGQLHLWRAPSWEEIAAAEVAEPETSLTP